MVIASLEDEHVQAQLIERILALAGHVCTTFTEGMELLSALQQSQPFDLLLIDWEIPDITGLDVVRWIRTHYGYSVPVLFITNRSLEEDLVLGLQAGADDYMVKPVRSAELLARIEALGRRQNPVPAESRPFSRGAYAVDPVSRTIELHGQVIALTSKEFDLALLFFRNPGRLFTRDVISMMVWNREIPASSRTLDTHLSTIRQKLQLHPKHGVRLSSSYALGYRLHLLDNNEIS